MRTCVERSWKSRLIGSRNSRSRFANVDLGRCLENRYQSRLCALLYAPLVTNADDKIEEHSPESVGTHYLFTMDEAIEHLHAANLLGFGVRLHSYLVRQTTKTRQGSRRALDHRSTEITRRSNGRPLLPLQIRSGCTPGL